MKSEVGVVTWEESTAGLTPEEKTLRAYEWAAGLAHQGEDRGSAWDKAMQECLPTMRRLVSEALT
jgi:hypothetical protein